MTTRGTVAALLELVTTVELAVWQLILRLPFPPSGTETHEPSASHPYERPAQSLPRAQAPPRGVFQRVPDAGRRAPDRRDAGRGPNGDIVALEGLDLEVRSGEFFGLLGPNGAGKTTTISILTTRGELTRGRAVVAGADVVRESAAVRQRIGVVPQRPIRIAASRPARTCIFHAAYFGIPHAAAASRADSLLAAFGLGTAAARRWASCPAASSSG